MALFSTHHYTEKVQNYPAANETVLSVHWQDTDLSHISLPTPPREDRGLSAVNRGRRCGAGGSRLSMMSGSEVLVTSSVEETDTENILTDMIVSKLHCSLGILRLSSVADRLCLLSCCS